MLLLEYDTIKKRQVNKMTTLFKYKIQVKDNNKKYKVKKI